MPEIRRENLPRALFRHLADRVREREISTEQLELMFDWLESEPEVPEGKWFKRFPEVTMCGEGELIKTFLRPDQAALGEEIDQAMIGPALASQTLRRILRSRLPHPTAPGFIGCANREEPANTGVRWIGKPVAWVESEGSLPGNSRVLRLGPLTIGDYLPE